MSLIEALEVPGIEYFSPEVVSVIDEIRHWSDDVKSERPEHGAWKTVPFILEQEAAGFVYKVDKVVEKIEEKVQGDVHIISKVETKLLHHNAEIERVVGEDEFKNWGETVRFKAGYTLVVRTIEGVCKVVRWAASEGRRVRVAGFRHSWRCVIHIELALA